MKDLFNILKKSVSGWAGSYKQDKCACGVNGNCAGGPTARCNCDMNDGVVRTDAGSIINTDSLPVCQVCCGTIMVHVGVIVNGEYGT